MHSWQFCSTVYKFKEYWPRIILFKQVVVVDGSTWLGCILDMFQALALKEYMNEMYLRIRKSVDRGSGRFHSRSSALGNWLKEQFSVRNECIYFKLRFLFALARCVFFWFLLWVGKCCLHSIFTRPESSWLAKGRGEENYFTIPYTSALATPKHLNI